MTREKAHEIYDDWSYMESSDVDVVIDDLYDEFESRVCKNCGYCKKDSKGSLRCHNANDLMPYEDQAILLNIDENFGCNQFKKGE